MKILMIGTDRKLFEANSEVRRRFEKYASLFEELHVIVFTRRGFVNQNLLPNLHMYPTNSNNRWWYMLDAYRIGRRIKNIDIISTQDPFGCGIIGWRIARRMKVKLQFQVHTDFLSPYFIRESFLHIIRVAVARFLLPKADCIRVVSERIKESLIERLNIESSKIITLPIFVHTEKSKKKDREKNIPEKYASASHILLIASRFTREKNIFLGIKAIQQVRDQYPNILLILVGDGPEREKINAYREKHGLQRNIIIEPWTNDLEFYYRFADIFLITSNYEGYGRTALEAASFHVPVVMTDVGIAIGFVVPVGDEKKLAQGIVKIIEDKEVKDRIVQNQQDFLNRLPTHDEYLSGFKNQFNACL